IAMHEGRIEVEVFDGIRPKFAIEDLLVLGSSQAVIKREDIPKDAWENCAAELGLEHFWGECIQSLRLERYYIVTQLLKIESDRGSITCRNSLEDRVLK